VQTGLAEGQMAMFSRIVNFLQGAQAIGRFKRLIRELSQPNSLEEDIQAFANLGA